MPPGASAKRRRRRRGIEPFGPCQGGKTDLREAHSHSTASEEISSCPPQSFPAFGSYVDDVGSFLSNLLDVDAATVREIMTHLTDAQALMPRDGAVEPLPGQVFGTLPAGVEMGTHSNAARDYVMGALGEMLTTLGAYDDGVIAFRSSVTGADELSAAELLRIARATTAGQAANDDEGN